MNIQTLYKSTVAGIILLLGLTACEGDLTSYNENPNAPQEVPAELILPSAITSSMDRLYSMSGLNGYVGSIWVQHYAKIQYVDEGRYDLSGRINMINGFWSDFYANTLNDLQRIKQQAEEGTGSPDEDANTIAIANILIAWNIHTMTDLWGPVPFTDALKGGMGEEEVLSPSYDSQEEVYTSLIEMLNTATDNIVEGAAPFGSADVIYNGDMTSWLQLANSLKLRIYMRMADVDPGTAAAGISAVYDDGNYIQSNEANAMMEYQPNPYNNPVNEFFKTREDHKISRTMVTHLKDLDDPRLHFYAMPTEASDIGDERSTYPDGRFPDEVYVGVRNGDVDNSLPLNEASNIGAYFMAPRSPGIIMTYAEVEFILAEAALRGMIETPAAAATHYESAVRASMEMFTQERMDAVLSGFPGDEAYEAQDVTSTEFPSGMTESEITNYLAGPGAFPATEAEQTEAIALQKWIALYGQGLQAWFEWRRLDHPPLTPGPTAVLDEVPKRLTYPSDERSVNEANLNEAIEMLGGSDNLITPVWWDVE